MKIDNITEGEAFYILHELTKKFGWTGTMFTRADAEVCLIEDFGGDEITDEQWAKVRDTWAWRKGIVVEMRLSGNEMLLDAIRDSGILDETSA